MASGQSFSHLCENVFPPILCRKLTPGASWRKGQQTPDELFRLHRQQLFGEGLMTGVLKHECILCGRVNVQLPPSENAQPDRRPPTMLMSILDGQ